MQATNTKALAAMSLVWTALFKAQKAETKAGKALIASEKGEEGSAPYAEALAEFKIRKAIAGALLQLVADQTEPTQEKDSDNNTAE